MDEEREYTIYRKYIQRATITATSLAEAWTKGKEAIGDPLINPRDYPDKKIRVRWKVIRKPIDEDKE